MADKFSVFAQTILNDRYAWKKSDGTHETWEEVADRVSSNVFGAIPLAPMVGGLGSVQAVAKSLIEKRILIPGGRYLYASGREFHQTQNCLLLKAEDIREGWADLLYKATMALMTGAGIGVVYSDLRAEGAPLHRAGGYSSGPIPLMQAVNEVGRAGKQGGNRRAAIWAGLHWNHPDALKFIKLKHWAPGVRALKEQDFNYPAPMDHTNISIILDDAFFVAYVANDPVAHAVYWETVRSACEHGDPGFSIDTGVNAGEHLRNACTEVTSSEDSDICNLASINLARISNRDEMQQAVNIGTAFLLAGTVYSDIPYAKVGEVRNKNRRLGLGLMGIHEFILKNGGRYGDTDALEPYLNIYTQSDTYGRAWAKAFGLNVPIKTRAIAPTGTIGIVAETTTGIEPIFCTAYKRRYFDHGVWRTQYVIDPTTRRLVADNIPIGRIEDAYALAGDVERRLKFQAYVQQYVDHGISSTINFPPWGSAQNNESTIRTFGDMLMKYLPQLRGITIYPDGAHNGQPLTKVDFDEALKYEGEVITEQGDVCMLRGGESCGA